MTTLEVENFAQIKEARIEFGDLTVLVGPQATGKSLVLQWLKLALDAREVVRALKEAGGDVSSAENLLDLTLGEGMSAAWQEKSSVKLDGRAIDPANWVRGLRKQHGEGKVFFIPAHRALLLADGWPAPFSKLNADTPAVARLFSQNLYQRFSGREAKSLFPVARSLKEEYRELVNDAVFHDASVELEKDGLRYRLRLAYKNGAKLPFMTWTAGQREFTPLMLGLYHVLPPRKTPRRKGVEWVVIEEPEMGLHPRAIAVVMLLVLELLKRRYRVVVSTHSPLVLEAVWAIQRIARNRPSRWQLLADAFGVRPSAAIGKVMKAALGASTRVFFLELDQRFRVTARDISRLDPGADDPAEADWGGLTGFSSAFGEAVRKSVNEAEAKADSSGEE